MSQKVRLVLSTVVILNLANFGSGWEQSEVVHSLSFNPSIVKSSRGFWRNQHASEGRHRVRRASKPSFQNTNHHELRKILLESQAKRKKSSLLDQSAINNEPGIIDVSKSSRNTSVLVGKQIILACQIPHEALGNESVSWIRHSDSGLLAVNDFVYTTSHRIKVFHRQGSPEWKLSINPVELSDAGLYQCQVSTTPHTSHFIALNVVEPKTTILGNHDMFIEAGSTINLTCIIQADSMREGGHIYWNYNGKIIAYDRNRGGTIVIDKRPGGMTVTSLIISHASPGDSGSYTCDPASAYAKSIQVHVGSDAGLPNELVRSNSDSQAQRKPLLHTIAVLVLFWAK